MACCWACRTEATGRGGGAGPGTTAAAAGRALGGGVLRTSGSVMERGVPGLLVMGVIGVPGPELLDSMMTSSSTVLIVALDMQEKHSFKFGR